MKKFLILLPLVLSLVSNAQKTRIDTLISFTERVIIDYTTIVDSMTMVADTLDLKGAFLKIHLTDFVIEIPQTDTFQILYIERRRVIESISDTAATIITEIWCQKPTGGEPIPIYIMLRKDFMTIDYPFINKQGRTIYFKLGEQRSISN